MSITQILAINLHSENDQVWFKSFDTPDYDFIPVNCVSAALRYLLEQEISMILCRVEQLLIEKLELIQKYAKMKDIPILFVCE